MRVQDCLISPIALSVRVVSAYYYTDTFKRICNALNRFLHLFMIRLHFSQQERFIKIIMMNEHFYQDSKAVKSSIKVIKAEIKRNTTVW